MSNLATVVVHGGAGDVPEARRKLHAQGCEIAASAGLEVLLRTGSALEAVAEAVRVLENDPLFNAGTGACLDENGELSLDASIMEGATLRAGAVAALPAFLNPILIAKRVLEDGHHAFYVSQGAEEFARRAGFSPVDPNAMITESARARLASVLAGRGDRAWAGGTVGAVACDSQGRVAAATSTGGTVGKRRGRVGDSPILGAGTYAEDPIGAASATGDGEAAIRLGLTRHACEFLRRGDDAQAAALRAIEDFGTRVQGRGGLILLSAKGDVGIAFNTATMSHAVAKADGSMFAGW